MKKQLLVDYVNVERCMMSHRDLLSTIGEVDSISLRSIDKHTVGVFAKIDGRELELIRDSGVSIDHSLTRQGIAAALARAEAERLQRMFKARRRRSKLATKKSKKRKAVPA